MTSLTGENRDCTHRGIRFRRFSTTTPIPNAAGIPTNRPPKMEIRMGDCAPFAPGKMKAAARRAKPMKKMPTLVGTGFPVTFMARSILSRSSQRAKTGLLTACAVLFAKTCNKLDGMSPPIVQYRDNEGFAWFLSFCHYVRHAAHCLPVVLYASTASRLVHHGGAACDWLVHRAKAAGLAVGTPQLARPV